MKNDIEIIYYITIRYFNDASLTKRIIYKNRIFSVLSYLYDDREGDVITFKAKEIV